MGQKNLTGKTEAAVRIAAEIAKLVDQLPASPPKSPSGSSEAELKRLRREAAKLRGTFENAITRLGRYTAGLDHIQQPKAIFDPSNPKVIARFVALALLAQPRKPLGTLDKFYGSGIYAIYYNGDFPIYKLITQKEHPIYVGLASPSDEAARTAIEQGTKICDRLTEHRKNILRASANLDIDDFEYRCLVVASGWQQSAENHLINLYKPVWNKETKICYGFGKHGDAAETRGNKRSPWDTLHPGRKWAGHTKLEDAKPLPKIAQEFADHFMNNPPLGSLEDAFKLLLAELSQT